MKTLITLLIVGVSFFSFSQVHAACADGTRSSAAGLSLQVNGCYTDGTHEYSLSTSSSTSAGYAPPASELVTGDNILGVDSADLRNGNVNMDTIPNAIVAVITFLLAIAGSLSVMALIYHAVKMQLASGITGDSSGVDKAKAGMKGAMIGFVVSILAWFLVTRFVEILGSIS